MLTSLDWLHQYLPGADVSADEADHVLTHAGFPIESREHTAGGDTVLDVELTSNRGDCLCHVGLAREIAAAAGHTLAMPEAAFSPGSAPTADLVRLSNEIPDRCPRFCARVVRGVRVGPSPKWLADRLEAVGVKTINNIVDATNYVLFELGHPSHAFDLATLTGPAIVVRTARDGESVVGLDDKEHRLQASDMVVADAERAVSIAGVIGGRPTSVTEHTTDILLEMATWEPASVRRTARRLGISTDSAYRYERYVDARDLEPALDRLTALVIELAGGEPSAGLVEAGGPLPDRTRITLRPARCAALLGVEIPSARITELLSAIGIGVAGGEGGTLVCTIPPHRHDLTREVDLIEEVIRLQGFEALELPRKLPVPLDLQQPKRWTDAERAKAVIARSLTAAGFYETVTFSFETDRRAALFLADGLRPIKIDEERRKDAPFLRPCITPGLLSVRKANQDARNTRPGGLRFFEIASTYAETDDGDDHGRLTVERPMLALLADAPGKHDDQQAALRSVRGVIEAVITVLGGAGVPVRFSPRVSTKSSFEDHAYAWVELGDAWLGFMGLINAPTLAEWDLDAPVIAAELDLKLLCDLYPPRAKAEALPAYPSIERDLSVIVEEATPWASIAGAIADLAPDRMVACDYVTTFRGKQIPAGRKSVTVRLEFRDPDRTLRHDEVDPQIEQVVGALRQTVGAELRA